MAKSSRVRRRLKTQNSSRSPNPIDIHVGARVRLRRNLLGLMYANGQGVALDIAEAWKWWRKAAQQGHAGAQDVSGLLLGGMNYGGAVEWYRKAAEQGDAESERKLTIPG